MILNATLTARIKSNTDELQAVLSRLHKGDIRLLKASCSDCK
jgi:hypothetical protein